MRLAVVTNILAPYRIPLFAELARRCELLVIVLAEQHATRDWKPQASGFALRTLPGTRIQRRQSVDPIHLNVGTWSVLRDFNPDVVIGGGFTPAHVEALAYCRLRGCAYVAWGELFLKHPSESFFLRRWVRHGLVRASNGWIASSNDSRDAFVRYGAPRERVMVSGMPVRNAEFRRHAEDARASGLVQALRARCGTPLLFGAGRLVSEKGWPQLLRALGAVRAEVPECSLVIAGDGPERDAFERLAQSLDLHRVSFIGTRDMNELAALYAAADVFVFPSLCDPYGAVLAEAIACGAFPVSSIHAAATRDLISDGESGYTAEPRDPASLASALIRALRMPVSERMQRVDQARRRLPLDDITAGADDILRYSVAVAGRRGAWPRARAARDP